MISYSVYCSLKEQICRNANLPLSVSLAEWRELMLRHLGEAGEDLGSLENPLFVEWTPLPYGWCSLADSVPLLR